MNTNNDVPFLFLENVYIYYGADEHTNAAGREYV